MVCAFYYLFIIYYKPDYSGYYFNAKVNVVDLEPSYWKYVPFDEVQLCQIKLDCCNLRSSVKVEKCKKC